MRVLWKAGCAEPSSKRSDRNIHALITLAQLGAQHSNVSPALFPFQWAAAAALSGEGPLVFACLANRPHSPVTRRCAT